MILVNSSRSASLAFSCLLLSLSPSVFFSLQPLACHRISKTSWTVNPACSTSPGSRWVTSTSSTCQWRATRRSWGAAGQISATVWWLACSAVRCTTLKCWRKMSSATVLTAPQSISMQVRKAQCSEIRNNFRKFRRHVK